jgi:hypothetical protein
VRSLNLISKPSRSRNQSLRGRTSYPVVEYMYICWGVDLDNRNWTQSSCTVNHPPTSPTRDSLTYLFREDICQSRIESPTNKLRGVRFTLPTALAYSLANQPVSAYLVTDREKHFPHSIGHARWASYLISLKAGLAFIIRIVVARSILACRASTNPPF